MTVFGRDSSHYTQAITDDNLRGLGFHTCKLTDGLHYYEDSTYKAQTDRAHNIGVPVLGSYHVLWGNRDLAGQADWWLQRVNALAPYWKSMPWIWQPDCESFGYNGLPTIAQINTFGDLICSKAGVPAERYTPYAPAWVYGDKLKSLRYKNYWGSNYGSNPSGHYVTVYPGDTSTRWNTYIPMTILQYGSNTDIGDANAFRGTLQQFLNTIKASGTSTVGVDMTVSALITNKAKTQNYWCDMVTSIRPVVPGQQNNDFYRMIHDPNFKAEIRCKNFNGAAEPYGYPLDSPTYEDLLAIGIVDVSIKNAGGSGSTPVSDQHIAEIANEQIGKATGTITVGMTPGPVSG
jgi:hypothetical protein